MLVLLAAGGLPAPVRAAAPGPVVLQCPSRIATNQSLREPAGAWTAERRDVGHALAGYTIFAGPVAGRGEVRETAAKGATSQYDFTGMTGQVRFVCLYRGTDMTLTHLLPSGIRRCAMTTVSLAHAPDRVTLACQ